MTVADVLELYEMLERAGVEVWIDGGWCVDALLGEVTREHGDLDVAVRRPHDQDLLATLTAVGFVRRHAGGSTPWSFVLAHADGRTVDVHVFDYDETGEVIYGIPYPYGSLTGVGHLAGTSVRCVSAPWMYRFKTSYPPEPKDVTDVRRLAGAFGFELPEPYR